MALIQQYWLKFTESVEQVVKHEMCVWAIPYSTKILHKIEDMMTTNFVFSYVFFQILISIELCFIIFGIQSILSTNIMSYIVIEIVL